MKLPRAYTDGPFGQIHFQHAWQGATSGRPVVLLHQAIMASGQFDNVFAPLVAHGLCPVAIDMPGFGLSDAPSQPPSIADYAQCVAPVLDALGIGRAAVAGHHTGALVGTEFALAHPERVSALVVQGAMVLPDEDRAFWTNELCPREKAFAAKPGGAHFADIAILREHYGEGITPERITDYVVQAMQAYRMGSYWFGHAAAFAYDHRGPLQRLSVPTLLLTNTGDMTHPWAEAARDLRPDFGWSVIEGGGIDIVDQKPQEWADAVAAFVLGQPE
ncbi:MAG TPA: alpha/beta hydrolase [Novosphingobium sp.]|nr:alpha/beta hydrolase [Novosphingobium sp.]